MRTFLRTFFVLFSITASMGCAAVPRSEEDIKDKIVELEKLDQALRQDIPTEREEKNRRKFQIRINNAELRALRSILKARDAAKADQLKRFEENRMYDLDVLFGLVPVKIVY